ncbi:hypothetical protein EG68_11927 [Paragonimus skrjabini miyazakii]|uniref:WDR19 WD40 repeat domain-containing protein n=1 Tax=Paragonimus skrjabini miyazakii TaxID=59628 RepID=A0A8S9Y8B2_9TREM|nr:hypothetical protein EG68_11927 [Paragonimus skrjabini miyazakii]
MRPGKETQTTTSPFRNNRGAFRLQWSDDGQLMAVSTPRQLLHVFLSQLPMLASVVSSGTANLTARLTSLLEVTVEQLPFSKTHTSIEYFQTPQIVKVPIEPTFISLSSKYLAVGMNNHAWFYEFTEKGFEVVSDYDYLDVVTNISVNDTYAAACGPSGKLTLHWIDPRTFPTKDGLRASPTAAVRDSLLAMTAREQRVFPDCSPNGSRQKNMKVTGFRLTTDFLIYATDTGQLTHFLLEDWANLHDYQHRTGIRSIYPNSKGTRVALIDDQAAAFVYNPVLSLHFLYFIVA